MEERRIIIEGPINEDGLRIKDMLTSIFGDEENVVVEFHPLSIAEHKLAIQDNDIAAMGDFNKLLREKRAAKAVDWIAEIIASDKCIEWQERQNGSYSITLSTVGIVDYFPKANNLLIRKENKWRKPGLKWLINHLKLR